MNVPACLQLETLVMEAPTSDEIKIALFPVIETNWTPTN